MEVHRTYDEFFAAGANALPAFERIEIPRDVEVSKCSHLPGLGISSTAQPVLTDGSAELARWASLIDAIIISITTEGLPLSTDLGAGEGVETALVPVVKLGGGVTVLTADRLVGTVMEGDFFGYRVGDRPGGQAVCYAFPFAAAEEVRLLRKKSFLKGLKGRAVQIGRYSSPVGAVAVDVLGTTTLEHNGARGPSNEEAFELLADAVAGARARTAAPSEREYFEAVRRGEHRQGDGDAIAIALQPGQTPSR